MLNNGAGDSGRTFNQIGRREEFRSRPPKDSAGHGRYGVRPDCNLRRGSPECAEEECPDGKYGEIAQTVNLWDAGTVQGEQLGQLESVSLPAALVRLTIVLPRHGAAGQYLVAITRDQNGNCLVAEKSATTVGSGSQQEITADLDLRKANAGQYFLSTTHERDQAAYYYPLQIK